MGVIKARGVPETKKGLRITRKSFFQSEIKKKCKDVEKKK